MNNFLGSEQSIAHHQYINKLINSVELVKLSDSLLLSANNIALKCEHPDIADALVTTLIAKSTHPIMRVDHIDQLPMEIGEAIIYVRDVAQFCQDELLRWRRSKTHVKLIINFDDELPELFADSVLIEMNELSNDVISGLLLARDDNEKLIAADSMQIFVQWISRYYPANMRYSCALDFIEITKNRVRNTEKINLIDLAEVIAGWQRLDARKLIDSSDSAKLVTHLKTSVLGQETSQLYLAEALQENNSLPHLLLLTSDCGVGEKASVRALAEFYNGSKRFELAIDFSLFYQANSLEDIYIASPELSVQAESLLSIVCNYPYVVLSFENVEQHTDDFIRLFGPVLATGFYCYREQVVSFKQALLVVMTNQGCEQLNELCDPSSATSRPTEPSDLIDLFKQEQPQLAWSNTHIQAMQQAVFTALTECFGENMVRRAIVVPLAPLSDTVIEQVVLQRLRRLEQEWQSAGKTFQYIPELIPYLMRQVLASGKKLRTVDSLFENQVQIALAPYRQSGTNVLLSLNDTGQWLLASPVDT